MRKTLATSAENQIILKNTGYVLEDADIKILIEALQYASNDLDMDSMEEIKTLQTIITALKEAL